MTEFEIIAYAKTLQRTGQYVTYTTVIYTPEAQWHVIFEEPKQVRALAWLFWGLSNHERRTVYELY